MDTEPPADRIIGYCTNVHAGATFTEAIKNLETYGLAIKNRVSPHNVLGIGWWLSRQSVTELFKQGAEGLPRLRPWFEERGLLPFTFNGFPYGDFHEPIVKHRVYEPDWSTNDRLGYTLALAAILAELSPRAAQRSISTLPIGWPAHPCPEVNIDVATTNLLELASQLEKIEQSTGVLIHLDLEPEPGCILQRSQDVVDFFQDHLIPNAEQQHLPPEIVFRHIRVCHDICHAAVMFENQATVIENYRAAGIGVGKVQVSSALRIRFDELSANEQEQATRQLQAFAEDRYLHQTMIRLPDGETKLYDDLPQALASTDTQHPRGEWRVHFHVPIFLDHFALIHTTQDQIGECLRAIKPQDEINHFEVETYAWDVLPEDLRTDDLAEGIAREILWLNDRFADGVTQ